MIANRISPDFDKTWVDEILRFMKPVGYASTTLLLRYSDRKEFCPQLDHEDLEQLDEFDLEEMDLKCATIVTRQGIFLESADPRGIKMGGGEILGTLGIKKKDYGRKILVLLREKGKLLLSPQQVVIGDHKDITGTKSPNTIVDQVIRAMTGTQGPTLAEYQTLDGAPVAFGRVKVNNCPTASAYGFVMEPTSVKDECCNSRFRKFSISCRFALSWEKTIGIRKNVVLQKYEDESGSLLVEIGKVSGSLQRPPLSVLREFRYLKANPNWGLWYPRVSHLELKPSLIVTFAGANLVRKSYIRRLKYVAILRGQFLDSKSKRNPVIYSKTKHIAIRHHFIRDAYKKKLIQVLKIHTADNVVDLLTKEFDVSSMVVLESCPKHNMVTYLEKNDGNTELHEIIKFLMRSSIPILLFTVSYGVLLHLLNSFGCPA
ncbi:hypothetical protein Tco_1212577 [Tanacetum coccineum]